MSRLHWYGPPYGAARTIRELHAPPSRWARYRLYTLDIYAPDEPSESSRYRRDRRGTYLWMRTDCGWEWLETRPVLRVIPPLRWLFGRLHDHVHTPGSW